MAAQEIVFARVVGTTTYGKVTASGNPTPTVTLEDPSGRRARYRYSSDAADAYGADEPDRRESFHAYVLTASGRIAMIDDDATWAYRSLVNMFPRGAKVAASVAHVSPSGMSRTVRLYGVDEYRGIVDMSHHAARVLGWKYDANRRGITVSGTGMNMLHHTVYELSQTLYGDADALTYYQI